MSGNSLPFFPKRQLALAGPPLPICQQQLHHVGTAIPPPYMNRLRLGRDKGCVPLGTGAGAGVGDESSDWARKGCLGASGHFSLRTLSLCGGSGLAGEFGLEVVMMGESAADVSSRKKGMGHGRKVSISVRGE